MFDIGTLFYVLNIRPVAGPLRLSINRTFYYRIDIRKLPVVLFLNSLVALERNTNSIETLLAEN